MIHTLEWVRRACPAKRFGHCSDELREYSRSLGHAPLIDHDPRRGEKIDFAPHEAQRHKERTQAERTNARLITYPPLW